MNEAGPLVRFAILHQSRAAADGHSSDRKVGKSFGGDFQCLSGLKRGDAGRRPGPMDKTMVSAVREASPEVRMARILGV